jgi:hypothetical protein
MLRYLVGYYASHFFAKQGAKIVGVIEHDGYVYNSKGLDVEALIKVPFILLTFRLLYDLTPNFYLSTRMRPSPFCTSLAPRSRRLATALRVLSSIATF